jgi:aspartate kinase
MIMSETPGMEEVSIEGVTLKEDLAMISLNAVPNRPGAAGRIFAEIARKHIVIDDIVQNIYDGAKLANVSFSTSAADAAEAKATCDSIAAELEIGSVELVEGVSKVSAIGLGMRTHAGIASTMFDALAKAEINIENISTSEIVISCMVRKEDGPKALRFVHDAFGLDQPV